MDISNDESFSAKRKKLKKDQAALKEEEEDQPPSERKQKKLKKERESSHVVEGETLLKDKPRVSNSVEGSSPKKRRKRLRDNSLEGKLAVIQDAKEEERKERQKKKQRMRKKKKNLQNDTAVVGDRLEDPQSEYGVHAEGHVKTVSVSFRLLIPSKDMGKVIGKQGSRIQHLREGVGAYIKIMDAVMNPGERVIWISSKEDTLTSQSAAERALLSVATLLIKPESEDQESVKIRLLVARSQARIVFSKDGQALDQIRADTGAIVSVFRNDRFPLHAFLSATDIILQLEGKHYQVQEALELVMTSLRESLQQSRYVKSPSKGGTFKTTVQIRVPKNYVGELIGKDGSTLWQIREECQVSVKVHDDTECGGQGKIVHLKGMLSQVTMAQMLLQVLLKSKHRAK